MSLAFAPQAVRQKAHPSQATVQKLLDENVALIQAITDFQNLGKVSECTLLQQKLHRNLVHLAAIADTSQSLMNELQMHPPVAVDPSQIGKENSNPSSTDPTRQNQIAASVDSVVAGFAGPFGEPAAGAAGQFATPNPTNTANVSVVAQQQPAVASSASKSSLQQQPPAAMNNPSFNMVVAPQQPQQLSMQQQLYYTPQQHPPQTTQPSQYYSQPPHPQQRPMMMQQQSNASSMPPQQSSDPSQPQQFYVGQTVQMPPQPQYYQVPQQQVAPQQQHYMQMNQQPMYAMPPGGQMPPPGQMYTAQQYGQQPQRQQMPPPGMYAGGQVVAQQSGAGNAYTQQQVMPPPNYHPSGQQQPGYANYQHPGQYAVATTGANVHP